MSVSQDHAQTITAVTSGQTRTPEEQLRLIRNNIPMDYLERHSGDLVAAMRDYSETRWRLIKRVQASEMLTAQLYSALMGLNESILGIAESNASGNPQWEYVSSRINAARAAIAKATGAA